MPWAHKSYSRKVLPIFIIPLLKYLFSFFRTKTFFVREFEGIFDYWCINHILSDFSSFKKGFFNQKSNEFSNNGGASSGNFFNLIFPGGFCAINFILWFLQIKDSLDYFFSISIWSQKFHFQLQHFKRGKLKTNLFSHPAVCITLSYKFLANTRKNYVQFKIIYCNLDDRTMHPK